MQSSVTDMPAQESLIQFAAFNANLALPPPRDGYRLITRLPTRPDKPSAPALEACARGSALDVTV